MYTKWWTVNWTHKNRTARMLGMLIICGVLLFSAGCSLLPEEQTWEEIPDITPPNLSKKPEHEVTQQTITSRVTGSGQIMSTREQELFFTLEGQGNRVHEVYVNNGDNVEQGELIAELDVTEMRNNLRTMKLDFRKKEIEMINMLRKANEMSADELEQAKIQFENDRTAIVELEEEISRAQLHAPFSGTIVSLSISPGDSIEAYKEVATVADLSQLAVAVELSDSNLEKVSAGMDAVINLNVIGQRTGKVERLPLEGGGESNDYPPYYPGGQEEKKTVADYLIIKLDEFPEEATRGTRLSAAIVTERKENAIVIPPSALRTYGGRTYVQAVDEDGLKREVDIQVGQQNSTQVEVLEGLEPGMKVVGR